MEILILERPVEMSSMFRRNNTLESTEEQSELEECKVEKLKKEQV